MNHTAEEVRAFRNITFAPSDPGYGITSAYADMIEAYESAVPIGYVSRNMAPFRPGTPVWRFSLTKVESHGCVEAMPIFAHPPAQAAQVDADVWRDAAADILGKSSNLYRMLCQQAEEYARKASAPAAEPVAQGEAADLANVLEVVNTFIAELDDQMLTLGTRVQRSKKGFNRGRARDELEYVKSKHSDAIEARDTLEKLPAMAAQPRAVPFVPETWQTMDAAPRDGTMLRLLVQFEDHATEDTTGPAPTIGAYCEDAECWQFAGWCWTHDHFTEGKGEPVGWLPMLNEARAVPDDRNRPIHIPAYVARELVEYAPETWMSDRLIEALERAGIAAAPQPGES